jgi:hypothetical protein
MWSDLAVTGFLGSGGSDWLVVEELVLGWVIEHLGEKTA